MSNSRYVILNWRCSTLRYRLFMTLNCIHTEWCPGHDVKLHPHFHCSGSFLYWCVVGPASQHFFMRSCIYLRILIISYLATFLGTNSISVLMYHEVVNQSNSALHLYLSLISYHRPSCTRISACWPIPTKSDAILLNTRQRNSTLSNISQIIVVGSVVPLSDSVKLLGVTLDKSLTFTKHANQVSQSCYYHLKAVRHNRHCLDNHTVSHIAHVLISSRLNCSYSVLYSAPHYVTHKLQRVQNSLGSWAWR